ncbi:MFS transporter [Streptomyces sp. A7024]|uniref:MFS transporter n=1 Tax=Streptomyces coryli TaxID=1128680 RepID=A0A6G4U657_9ACTN|nr:MFS transporter [Streptomyces coryli]NGN67196.1 MFS transporter [Streptomyces coryli]
MTALRSRPAATLAVVLLGFLTLPMSMSGTTVAVPGIGRDLDASGGSLQWVVTGYFLMASSFMLVAGSLGDLFGRRRIYRGGALLYGAGTLASAAAPGVLFLDVARSVTGIGAAGVMAGGGAVLASTFEGPARTRAFAAVGTTAGVGLAAGPTVAGWLVGGVGWRAAFAVFAAVAALLLAGTFAMPESRAGERPKVDWAGAGLFIGGLGAVLYAVTRGGDAGWTSAGVLGPLVVGAVLLALFPLAERRAERPVLDLGLLGNRRFMGWIVAAVVMALGMAGVIAYLPSYLQGASGLTAGDAGLAMLMPTVPMLLMPPLAGRLVNKGAPPRLLITLALTAMAAGNAWLTVLDPDLGPYGLLGPLATIGAGAGLAAGIIDAQAMSHVPEERVGMASGLLNTVRGGVNALAMTVFGAVLVALLTGRLDSARLAGEVATGALGGPPARRESLAAGLTDAWQAALWGVAGLSALGAAVVWALLAGGARRQLSESGGRRPARRDGWARTNRQPPTRTGTA